MYVCKYVCMYDLIDMLRALFTIHVYTYTYIHTEHTVGIGLGLPDDYVDRECRSQKDTCIHIHSHIHTHVHTHTQTHTHTYIQSTQSA
jgi:hypothetical protein